MAVLEHSDERDGFGVFVLADKLKAITGGKCAFALDKHNEMAVNATPKV